MATIDQIKPDSPVIIDPAKHDLDRLGLMAGVEGTESITLHGEDATNFLSWVREYWRAEFEEDLQGLSTHVDHGDLLTTWVPLVTFREDLCARAAPRQEPALASLLDTLRQLLREWRSAGVDTVMISGRDARRDS